MIAYFGELLVEGGVFTINVERLILGDSEISFSFFGIDSDGAYKAEGVAVLSGQGDYVSKKLTLTYSEVAERNSGVIHFNLIEQTPKLQKCKVAGKWILSGDSWSFSGILKKFAA